MAKMNLNSVVARNSNRVSESKGRGFFGYALDQILDGRRWLSSFMADPVSFFGPARTSRALRVNKPGRLSKLLSMLRSNFEKNQVVKSQFQRRDVFRRSLGSNMEMLEGRAMMAGVPYVLSSGNYSENFSDIANWTDNFAAGTGAGPWGSVAVNATGTIPDGGRTTVSSATFATGSSGGVQRGSLTGNPAGTLVLLTTGSTDNTSAVGVELFLDFTGRNAGSLTYDSATVFNSTGNRGATLQVYTSTNGTNWTLLTGVTATAINNVAGSATLTAALPASFNGSSTARLRFYEYNGTGGTTGSRPKFAIDNVVVTSTSAGNVSPSISGPTFTSVTATTATLGGNITNNGGAAVTASGIVYAPTGTNSDPLIGGTGVVSVSSSPLATSGVFTVPATGLTGSTGYSFKAFATNSIGTTYTTVITFTTQGAPVAPSIGSPTSTAITFNSATLGGNVTSDGNSTITARGGVYALTSANATLTLGSAGTTTVTGTGTTGVFTVSAPSLAASSGYTFVAYVTNGVTTTYSSPATFTTVAAPTVLAAGDISIIGFNSNTPDGFAFVTWVDLAPNTVVKFTDNAFLSSGSATDTNNGRGGENFVTWTNSTSNPILAGTVIRIVNDASLANLGTVVQALSGISNSGDQIFAYQGTGAGTSTSTSDFGTNANPSTFTGTILFGLNFGSDWLTTSTTSANLSYRPSELASANRSIVFTTSGTTSGQYTGARTEMNIAAFKTAVTDPSNWTMLTTVAVTTLDTTAFNISSAAITGTATATAFTIEYGTASAAQTFSISGSGLTANLIATAPTGFQVSSDGTNYGNTATFTQTSGSASGSLRVRVAATAAVTGTYNSQNIVLSSTGATPVNIVTAASGNSVTAKGLTIIGLTATNKNFDGNTTVSVTGTPTYVGLVNGETPSVTGTVTWAFPDSNVGSNKTLTRSGSYNAPSTNYSLTQPTLTASINATAPSITSPTSSNLTTTGATLGGNVTGGGGVSITAYGVVYARTSDNIDPVIGGSNVTTVNLGTGSTGVFTTNVTGLTDTTGYSFKAYATNSVGTTYTTISTFSTLTANTAPVITSNGGGVSASININENSTAVTTVTATDTETPSGLTYSITGPDAVRFTINSSTGVLAFASAPNFETPIDVGTNNVYDVTVTVTDPGSLTVTQNIAVTVTDVNEAPTVTSGSSASFAENGTATAYTITATDPDASTTLTYSITGTDASLFSVDSSTGLVSFNTAPNFEWPADANSDNIYQITITASDGTLSDNKAVSITVTNVNESPSITSGASFSTPENTTAVTTVTANDPDAATTFSYSITGGADSALFSINSSTGALNFATAPNFETPTDSNIDNVYNVIVQVSDGSLTVTQAIAVTVTNVNENPFFSPNTATFAIADLATNGTFVGTVTAQDPDAGDTRTYSITAGNGTGTGAFAINSSTGQITVADGVQIDYSVNSTFTISVTATDAGSLTGTSTVTINLVQNQAPIFSGAPYTFGLNENSSNSTSVGSVSATDPDAGQTVTYSITAGNTSGAFVIDSSSGAITVANSSALNFETTATFTLTVTATDNATTPLSSNASVTVNLTNVNEAPTIAVQSFTIAENLVNGSTVGTVVAADVDAGDTKTFAITSGNAVGAFAISSTTGAITVADASKLDFEITPSFALIVSVTDAGSLSAINTITVNLTNVNEAPTLAAQTFTIAENLANGSVVGTAVATDVDAGDTKTFAITSGNASGAFAISATTGAITVADASKLDFETTPSFALTVSATDAGSLSASNTITVNLTNVNEAPTLAAQTFTIAENLANGSAVGTVVVADEDAGDTKSFAITSGNASGAFAINATSGAITVADASKLDFETTSSFALTVSVTDAGNLSASNTVTVNLNNVNETPVFGSASYSFSVAENSTAGTSVGSVSATDPDTSTTLVYSLSGTGASNFAISPSSGAITVAAGANLNFEGTASYALTVSVTDGSLPTTAAVAITLTNVNEAPVFGSAIYSFSVAENSASGTAVGTASATDPDASTTLVYSLSGTGASNFAINPSTGAITVAAGANLNFEGTASYALTVSVTDGTLPSTAAVAISLTNVNEAPVFGSASYSFSVAENSASGTAVGSVIATDPDASTTLVYSLSGTGATNFAIDALTGAITVAVGATLNFEGMNSFSLTASVSDATNSVAVPVAIALTNVNEGPLINAQSFSIAENLANGLAVGMVVASDPDTVDTLIYSIIGGNGLGGFAINASTGQVTVANSLILDFEANPSFNLIVEVKDAGNLTASNTVTVNLTNVNEAPTIAAQSFSIPENTLASTSVGSVIASDVDAGDTKTYAITGGNISGAFAINASTGEITVANSAVLNFEVRQSIAFTVRITDTGSLSASNTVTVNLTNVNEAPTVTSGISASFAENGTGTVYTITASDADAGTTMSYSISGTDAALFNVNSGTGVVTFITPPNFEAPADADGNNVYDITVAASDGSLSNSKVVAITVINVIESFNVTRVTPTYTGFVATFNQAFVGADLNLYGNAALGVTDVTLVGATVGNIKGSLILNAANNQITFVQTQTGGTASSASGILPNDSYTVTLRSAANGFHNAAGILLDGDADEVAGGDLVFSFYRNVPASAVTVSIPDFARGHNQTVNVPATSNGLPVYISTGQNVSSLQMTLVYDSSLLDISNFTPNTALSTAGVAFTVNTTVAGQVTFDVTSSTELSSTAGALLLGTLSATVPSTANYTSKEVLDITDLTVFDNDPGIPQERPSLDDDAVHVAAYFGDTSGNRQIQPNDGTLLARVNALLDTGFAAYQLADPVIIADISGNNQVQPNDGTLLARYNALISTPQIPAIPTPLNPLPLVGIDPILTIGSRTVATGTTTVTLPVTMMVPLTEVVVGGVTSFKLLIGIDNTKLSFATNTGFSTTGFAAAGFSITPNQITNGTTTTIILNVDGGAFGITPAINPGATITLGELTFTILAGATGSLTVNLLGDFGGTTTQAFDDSFNELFKLVGGVLSPLATNGFDADADGVITVGTTNQAPTDILLSSSSIAENALVNATVGTFSTVDPNAGNTFTYTLATGAGSTDNASFSVTGNILTAVNGFNFETKSSYTVRVRTTDQGGLFFEKAFTISVTNVNETPADIALSSSSIGENAGANATVGILSTVDPDVGNTFTYTLVTGLGSTDNASFNISGTTLRASASFNFEAKSSYTVRVRTTDQGGLFFEKAFTINVTNVNETPTDIALSNATIFDNAGANATVGTLSTVDPDASNTFTYTLVTGTGSTNNGLFNISANLLRATASIPAGSYSVRIRTTDQGGLAVEKAFAINVAVNVAAISLSIGSNAVASGTTTVTLPVTMMVPTTGVAVGGVTSFKLLIGIDNTKLSFATNTGFSTTGFAAAGFGITPNQITNGTTTTIILNVDGGATGVTPQINPGATITLGELTFTILAGASGSLNVNLLGDFGGTTTQAFDDGFNELFKLVGGVLSPLATNNFDADADGIITIGSTQATLLPTSINSGTSFLDSNQRSQIVSLTVNFSSPVTLGAGAFTLENTGLTSIGSSFLATSQIVYTPGTASSFVITFGAGAGVVTRNGAAGSSLGNSLADGNYRLTVDPTKVAGNNVFGELASDRFFRMYGDSDGSGVIDGLDTVAFRRAIAFGNAAMDVNGDGLLDAADRGAYSQNFNKRRRGF